MAVPCMIRYGYFVVAFQPFQDRMSDATTFVRHTTAGVCVCVCVCYSSGCVHNTRGYVGLLTITWGLGILVSAPCTADRRLLASGILCSVSVLFCLV